MIYSKYIAFFLILSSITVQSQTVTFSPNELKDIYSLTMMAKGTGSFWVYQEHRECKMSLDGYVEYGNDLKAGALHKWNDLEIKPTYVYDAVIWDNKFTLLYEATKKRNSILYLDQLFNNSRIQLDSLSSAFIAKVTSTGMMGSDIPLKATNKTGNKLSKGGNKLFEVSHAGKSGIYISHDLLLSEKAKKEKQVECYFIDNATKERTTYSLKVAQLSGGEAASTEFIGNSDKMVLITRVNDKEGFTVRFYCSITDRLTGKTSELPIPPIENAHYFIPEYSIGEDNLLSISGFYSMKKSKGYSGYYAYSVDLSETAMKQSHVVPFNEKGIAAIGAIKDAAGESRSKGEWKNLDDGSRIFIVQKYTKQPNSYSGFPAVASGYPTKYFGIYLLSFDKAGNCQWFHEIERKEKENSDMSSLCMGLGNLADNGSWFSAEIKNNMHLYFNEEGKVWDYTISPDGKFTGKNLVELAGKESAFIIYPNQGLQLSDHEIVFPVLKGKVSTLAKISY